MTMNQQTDRDPELFTCSECGEEWDADNLFVPEMTKLAKMKAERDGQKEAHITPEDPPQFAVCEDCRYDDDTYTLASTIASSKAYQRSRSGRNKPTSKRTSNKARSQATVTDVEANELVSCFNCEALGEETLIPRHEAQAPGWMGCNILQAYRKQEANQLEGVSITSANLSTVGYVSSEDLLRSGKEGFVICAECADTVITDLQEKAVELGFTDDEVVDKIQPWSLVPMIKSVRRKERKNSR